MSDKALWADYTAPTSNASTVTNTYEGREVKNSMDRDAFLSLLVTQMRYQDPLSPMDNKDSMAQLAQFSSLEQMQNVAKASYQQQAYSLLGKVVIGTNYNEDTGEYDQVFGRVDAVRMKNGEPWLVVGQKEIQLTKVEDVIDNPEVSSQMELLNANMASLQSLSIVGKIVQGIVLDENNKPSEYIEGKVDYFKIVDGRPTLVIGNKEVRPEQILSVGENDFIKGKEITAYIEDGDGQKQIEGKIDGINIVGDKFFVSINGENAGEISSINDLTKLLAFVNKTIVAEKTTEDGTVIGATDTAVGVVLKEGIPYLIVGDEEFKIDEIKEVKDKITL